MTGPGGRSNRSVNVVAVRRAAPDDVDAIVDLYIAVVEEGKWLGGQAPVDRAERRERFLDEIERTEKAASLVATVDDEIVGHVVVDVTPYNVAGLGMMVDAEWRGRGVGGALVRGAIDAARQLGAHKVALQVWPHNAAALGLYRKFGFVEEGRLRRHYRRRDGELWDAVVMGLLLDVTG